MKKNKLLSKLSYILITLILLTTVSCNNIFINKILPPEAQEKTETSPEIQKYGSLAVNDNSDRAIKIDQIASADITVSGKDFTDITKEVTVSNGTGSAQFEQILVGKNRIVTVEAKRNNFQNIKEKMSGIVMRGITDINLGANTAQVNWASTAVGNVYYELVKTHNFDVSTLLPETVISLIPSNTHAALINTAQIATDIKNSTTQTASAYALTPGSVSFTTDVTNTNAIIQICDPVSEKITGLTASEQIINNIAPGTWDFYVIVENTILYTSEVTVTSNNTTSVGTITLKTPTPRLEKSTGNSLTDLIQRGSAGTTKTVYLACRTYDGETASSNTTIYYTTDGTTPTTSSSLYNSTTGLSIYADRAVTLKAIAVKEGFSASNTATFNFTLPILGATYPITGTYSPVDKNGDTDGFGWSTQTYSLGSTITGNTATFAIYSKNATKILLEIYDTAYGNEAKYDYWMEKGTDNIWRAELNGITSGTLYAYRCWGPNWTYDENWKRGNSVAGFSSDYDSTGNRFNPNKVLFDPYTKEMSHDKSNLTALSGVDGGIYGTGSDSYKETIRRNFDTGKYAPKSVVISDSTSYGTKPQIAQKDASIYEAHVRGLTKHSSSASLQSILAGIDGFDDVVNIPTEYQGTYKGAGMMAPYLKGLGINTIELLPVHETDNDANPDNSPGGNFWGYMTYGYFAPDRRYSSNQTYGGPTKEFKEMVKAFHDAGIEVYLDVVFNHSGEGGPWYNSTDSYNTAELTFLRGFDCSEYYMLTPSEIGDHWNTTGCGNNLRADNPVVRNLILDSLTYWIDEMGVDGYRFDLAPVLGRVFNGSDSWNYVKSAKTIADIMALGTEKNVEMIAEAWDIGAYEVGNFPDGWGEWNGRYRDSIRSYVGNGSRGSLNDYIYGDYSNFNDQGGPAKSVNFIVAHDGFTLADLSSFSGQGNSRNSTLSWPFGPSDGGNGDTNYTAFGTTAEAKRQANRNYTAIQMISRGVPMIVYGDELSRTQNGNNNPYNIDSVATWNNYNMINTSSPHTLSTGTTGTYTNSFGTFNNTQNVNGNFLFMQYMLKLREKEPAFRQNDYSVSYSFKKEDGTTGLGDGDRCVWLKVNGSSVTGGSDYLVFMNMYTTKIDYTIPSATAGKKWVLIVDTASWAETNYNVWDETKATTVTSTYGVNPWSVVILKEVSTNAIPPIDPDDPPVISAKSGVMLQGFNWGSATRIDSSRWGTWYNIMNAQASSIKDTFAYVWFPPPSKTDTSSSEGYGPTQLNDLNNCYGTEAQLKSVISAISPAKAIADVVVNHRAGTTSWGDFTNPAWGVVKGSNYQAICSDDEGFTGEPSLMGSVPSNMRGAADTGSTYAAYRDLDHTNTTVQNGIVTWMNDVLKDAGFVGWRYDFVKGFSGEYVGQYNEDSNAEFSVGEYWPTDGFSSSNPSGWGNEIKSWITATDNGGTRSKAFDFALKGIMNTVFGNNASNVSNQNYTLLANTASLLMSQPSDAVTFIDNHDTGSTQAHWYLDPVDIGTAYAFILTHPGYPCVAWQHYFTDAQSGNHGESQYIGGNTVPGTTNTYKQHIDYLINLRKTLGIEYDDTVTVLDSSSSYYAGKITGTNGELVVVIGNGYTPTGTGYTGNNPIYSGTNFAIYQKGASGSGSGGGNQGGEPEEITVTFTANDWSWSGSVEIFAWCFGEEGSSYGAGQWIKCTGSGTTINLTCNNDITDFVLVRCPAGTVAPDWSATGDTAGRIYNKTADISYTTGTTSYTTSFVDYDPSSS